MIVAQQPGGGVRVVSQPDHADAAAQLARRWRRPVSLPEAVWPRFLEAVRRHDEGWRDAEALPAVDERGRPHNFKSLPTPEHLAIWRRSIGAVTLDDLYAGLLVALHARWLYTHVAEVSAAHADAVTGFIAEVDQRVDGAIALLASDRSPAVREAVTPERLATARRLLGAFDAISLMLAGGLGFGTLPEPVAFGEQEAAVAVTAGLPGAGAGTAGVAGVGLAPWPCAGGPFEVVLPARVLGRGTFSGAVDLAAALAAAPVVPMRVRVAAGGAA